jgi:hypothetical protein
VKLEQDKEREVDRTPESLIYVEGVEAQALFNFLMNCKSSTASTGPLAGVPPTLLAPVAFHGATLKSLKVCHKTDIVNLSQYGIRFTVVMTGMTEVHQHIYVHSFVHSYCIFMFVVLSVFIPNGNYVYFITALMKSD